jgi:hypothetical protein
MLGQPVAAVAQPLSMAREIERIGEGLRGMAAFGDRRKIEYGKRYHVRDLGNGHCTVSGSSCAGNAWMAARCRRRTGGAAIAAPLIAICTDACRCRLLNEVVAVGSVASLLQRLSLLEAGACSSKMTAVDRACLPALAGQGPETLFETVPDRIEASSPGLNALVGCSPNQAAEFCPILARPTAARLRRSIADRHPRGQTAHSWKDDPSPNENPRGLAAADR